MNITQKWWGHETLYPFPPFPLPPLLAGNSRPDLEHRDRDSGDSGRHCLCDLEVEMNAWQKFKRVDKIRFSDKGWRTFPRAHHTGFGVVTSILSDTMIRVQPEGLLRRQSMHIDFWEKDTRR